MTDDGLTFFATIRKTDGSEFHRETPNRFELLAWLAAHRAPEDDLTISIEAKGPAVSQMLLAIQAGAARMLPHEPKDPHEGAPPITAPDDVRLYHYSAAPFVFDPSRVYTFTTDDSLFKPNGLWVSVEKDGDEDYRGWKDWCEQEDFGLSRLAHRTEVVLRPSANVLVISDEPSLRRFHAAFQGGHLLIDGMVDWPLVIASYDGLIIAPMVWECRLELLWYYGWDCSSGCIWNLDAVAAVKGAADDRP